MNPSAGLRSSRSPPIPEIVADPLCLPVIPLLPRRGIQEYQLLGPDPFFTLGQTLLWLTAQGETAWLLGGSGCSYYETVKPSSQKETSFLNCSIADVAADADPNTGAAIYSTDYQGVGT